MCTVCNVEIVEDLGSEHTGEINIISKKGLQNVHESWESEHVVYSTQARMLKLELKKMYPNNINKRQKIKTTNMLVK